MKKQTPWRQLLKENRLIQSIIDKIIAENDLNRLLQMIVDEVSAVLKYDHCGILLLEKDILRVHAVSDNCRLLLGIKVQLSSGVTGRCVRQRKVILINDLSRCKYYVEARANPDDPPFLSEICAPIIFGDKVLGIINIESTSKNSFSEKDRRILETLSGQLAIAINKAALYSQLNLIQQISNKIVSIINLPELLRFITLEVEKSLNYDSCAIFLVENQKLVLRAVNKLPEDKLGLTIEFGHGVVGKCAVQREALIIGDIGTFPDYIPSGFNQIQSEIAIPILYSDELLGVLTIESSRKHAFDREDTRLLTILSQQIAVAIKNAYLYQQMERNAITDPVTGLYNHRFFYEKLNTEIARAKRYKSIFSLVMIDLDNFKLINDNCGHVFGDRILQQAAQIIRTNIRKCDDAASLRSSDVDIAARYGGDEFALILPETPLTGAEILSKRLQERINKSIWNILQKNEQGKPISEKFGTSMGIAEYQNNETDQQIVERADRALYRAKRNTKKKIFRE